MEPTSDKATSTVIISDRFSERRAASAAREAPSPRDNDPALGNLGPGTKLGRYLVINQIGGGGMGHVYKAQDTELNRTVALKVLPPNLCRHPDYLRRFRTEAQAQARMSSPYITTLYSFMELAAGEVLVMEHFEGQTIAQMLRTQGPLSMERAVRFFEQALRGIEHIHRQGVVHRDLKPSNIFITSDEQVKLMDFGVARIVDQHDPAQSGTMVGTLLYISPEQINGRETDFRSDIYTLGVSLFEAITGRLPFERRSDYALMHAHVQEQPPRPNQYLRRVSPALEWVILKAVEKDPARRFQSASEFRAALLRIGVLERRDREAASTSLRHLWPDTEQLRQEFRRYRLSPRSRLFGGLGFDIALVVLAAGLAFSLLGIPPFKSNAGETVSKPVVKNAALPRTPAWPAARAPIVRTAPVATQAETTPTPKPTAARYQQLRQAWGD
mgnify:FL=1